MILAPWPHVLLQRTLILVLHLACIPLNTSGFY